MAQRPVVPKSSEVVTTARPGAANLNRAGRAKGSLPVTVQTRIDKLDELFTEMGFDPAGSLATMAEQYRRDAERARERLDRLVEALSHAEDDKAKGKAIKAIDGQWDIVTTSLSAAERILCKLLDYSYYKQVSPSVGNDQPAQTSNAITVTFT